MGRGLSLIHIWGPMGCLTGNYLLMKGDLKPQDILALMQDTFRFVADVYKRQPQERIPGIQRVLIRKCILAKKPVIVATQMLHTMISNPRPTRAEVTDCLLYTSRILYIASDA